jgi:hypothetical protein
VGFVTINGIKKWNEEKLGHSWDALTSAVVIMTAIYK